MPFTLIGFYENVDPAAAFNALTALADQHITVSGDDVRVPTLNQVVAVAVGAENAVAPLARLVSPSLRRRTNLYLAPLNVAAAASVEPGSPQRVIDLRRRPIQLVTGENLNVEVNSNPVAAQDQWGLVWLADGPIAPVEGAMFTIRATATTDLTANVWSNVAITFQEDLPRGRYQCVGLRGESASMIACRLVFPEGGWRPGVLGCDAVDDIQHEMFRYGGLGVFGEFEDTTPPTVDALADLADVDSEYYLDLIQLREGPA